jgi:hypothetical protein
MVADAFDSGQRIAVIVAHTVVRGSRRTLGLGQRLDLLLCPIGGRHAVDRFARPL